ncbi:MAG: hypothetical protein AB7I30_23555, partial [Isosphaeraceae bacterium]
GGGPVEGYWNGQRRRLAQVSTPAPFSPSPTSSTQPAPARTTAEFAPNLGISFERVVYADGTFGARLTGPPVPNSPAATLGLEPGDTVFALDGARFRSLNDVLNHRARTSVEFIDVRTNAARSSLVQIP